MNGTAFNDAFLADLLEPGVAYYRAGRYREAVDALRPSLERQEDKYLALDL